MLLAAAPAHLPARRNQRGAPARRAADGPPPQGGSSSEWPRW